MHRVAKQIVSWGGGWAAWVAVVALAVGSTQAMGAKPFHLELKDDLNVGEFNLAVGKSQIIVSPKPLSQLIIGNPNIADVKLLSNREVLILGKAPGTTNLAFRDKKRKVIALVDVVVGYNLSAIKRKLRAMLPNEDRIEVRSVNDTIMLSGQVSSVLAMDTALSIAGAYTPGGALGEKLVNHMQIGGSQQVLLEVTLSEMARKIAKDLAIDTFIKKGDFTLTTGLNGAAPVFSAIPGILPAPIDGIFPVLGGQSFGSALLQTSALDTLNVRISALEDKGLAVILAEPRMIALSGQEASFLAGGEFPVPAAQSSGGGSGVGTLNSAIAVEFKEFGVGLKFTPTVLNDNHISLKLNTEVSRIDPTLGTISSGTFIPGVNTRRTATTVELGDGESFAIAGLLQNDSQNTVQQYPGLGDLPILGALFRSTGFQRNETELVIAVTPHLVQPVPSGTLAFPTDDYIPPNDIDQYLMGRLEGKVMDQPAAAEEPASTGIEGAYGHQL